VYKFDPDSYLRDQLVNRMKRFRLLRNVRAMSDGSVSYESHVGTWQKKTLSKEEAYRVANELWPQPD